MTGAFIVHEFSSGKRTVKGKPNSDLRHFETVTVIDPSRIDEVLGVKSIPERVALLRQLRDSGSLIVSEKKSVQRLTHVVRGEDGVRFRGYVFNFPDPDYIRYAVDRLRNPDKYTR